MVSVRASKDLVALGAAVALFCALLGAVLMTAPRAGAADAGSLEAKLVDAREEAGSIAAGLQASRERLAVAEGEAAAAAAKEERLSGLLAEGQERAAALARKLAATREQLAVEKARLRRSRDALAARLVAIYESGTPSTAGLIFGSTDYQELSTRADYLRMIEESDSALADRVAQVRDEVRKEAELVAELEARAVAYNERLAAARAQIASVREAAQAAAARQQSIAGEREASLADLKARIGEWVKEVQEVRAAEARAATEAEAEEEVGRWLGGPYAIPTYIVMCESGGNYSALNPSSGAGGAYQIIPSTWALYGGQGEPQNAPKEEQDRIAGEIWADSGGSAWVCA
ncbi:MAG TPA: transglycosylase family protein [Solirubrobacterales bacterium]|nr:transglycosylase family protein [Solirubrobacterales bacterium]